jgi:hypothetical protein
MTSIRYQSPILAAALALALGPAAGCAAPAEGPSEDPAATADALTSNEKTAYAFFAAKGLHNFQAAGIVGNLIQESGVSPTISQYGGGPGRGIAQWSAGGRWDTDANDNAVWYAHREGESVYSLNLQLAFVWYELETFPGYGLSELRSSTTLSSATVAFQDRFEGCGQCDESNRIAYAQQVLSAYGASPPAAPTQSIAPKPSGCGEFKAGQGLGPGEAVHSCDGRFELIMQSDGNLVLYEGSHALWATGTNGKDGYAMWMQSDGNFVLYNPYQTPLWASGTYNHAGAWLAVQDDGNLVVYSSANKPLWASNTCCH